MIARDEPQAPPQTRIAEVVRMPAVPPQAVIEHAAAIRGIGLEARELPVRNRFEQKADVQSAVPAIAAGPRRDGCARYCASWTGIEISQTRVPCSRNTLVSVCQCRLVGKAVAIRSGVARVFALAVIAPVEIDAEPGRPQDSEHRDERAAHFDAVPVAERVAHERDDAECRPQKMSMMLASRKRMLSSHNDKTHASSTKAVTHRFCPRPGAIPPIRPRFCN